MQRIERTAGRTRRWIGTFVAGAALFVTHEAHGQTVYNSYLPPPWKYLPTIQMETIATNGSIGQGISNVLQGASIGAWQNLQPGEFIDCVPSCIQQAEPGLYVVNRKSAEIAAWWLGKRDIYDSNNQANYVFGRTVQNLTSSASGTTRQYAAAAIGEFRNQAGVAVLAASFANDSDPDVRAADMAALGRQQFDGSGAINSGMNDSVAEVRLAALNASLLIPTFSNVSALQGSVAGLLGDSDMYVRRRAVQVVEAMAITSALPAILNLARTDPEPTIRAAACHCAGIIGGSAAKSTLQAAVDNDSNGFVVDIATFALQAL